MVLRVHPGHTRLWHESCCSHCEIPINVVPHTNVYNFYSNEQRILVMLISSHSGVHKRSELWRQWAVGLQNPECTCWQNPAPWRWVWDTRHWQRGENLLKTKTLALHGTELCSQSPGTPSKQNIKMPKRKDGLLLQDSVTGKTGFNVHFISAVCLDRDKSCLGYLKQVIQYQRQLQILTRIWSISPWPYGPLTGDLK